MKDIKRTKLIITRIFFLFLMLYGTKGYSCINCNKNVQDAITGSLYNNPLLLSGFVILTILVLFLAKIALKVPDPFKRNSGGLLSYSSKTPLTATAMVLGIGLGGFIDGIVLHQILQWHEMLSNKISPSSVINKSVNMFWDGIFHSFTLLATIIGIYLLWKVLKNENSTKSSKLLIGGMLAGWGTFNLLEGVLNHHILKLHNVREISTSQDIWNYGFLFFGLVLVFAGIFIIRNPPRYDKF